MRTASDQNSTAGLLPLVLPVVAIWGGNFAVMRIGVGEAGPFTLAAMRFTIASVPFLLFIQPPSLPAGFVLAYSATFGLGQFGLLFLAIELGLTSGLASLLVQLQVVFTPILALIVLKERIPVFTIVAITVSLSGLATILWARSGLSFDVVPIPILLGTAAAFSWGASNVVVSWGTKRGYTYNGVALVVWASAALPGPFAIMAALNGEIANVTSRTLAGAFLPALYLGLLATVGAYFLWVTAISRYSATTVAPFSLLIPMIAIFVGWLVFGEALSPVEAAGCTLVVAGVVIHVLGVRRT